MNSHIIIAIVGLTGSGKTEAARYFELSGFSKIRFGDITDEYLQQNNLEKNEENEKRAREFLRKKYGMSAYAKLNESKIHELMKINNVVIDGLYSWEEFTYLKSIFQEKITLLAIYAPPALRHIRLNTRHLRPLTKDEAISRDYAEIEHLNKAGPIAFADFTVINTTTLIDLKQNIDQLIRYLLTQ